MPAAAADPAGGARETARLLLRPVGDDVDAVWRIYSDPRTNVHNPAGPMTERSVAVDVVRRWVADWALDGLGYWAVAERTAPGVVVGVAGVRRASWLGRTIWNLHYRFAPEAWGRGLATEAAREAVSVWRDLPSPDPVVARTTPDNVPSRRTALAAGLERRADLDADDGTGVSTVFALGWP